MTAELNTFGQFYRLFTRQSEEDHNKMMESMDDTWDAIISKEPRLVLKMICDIQH